MSSSQPKGTTAELTLVRLHEQYMEDPANEDLKACLMKQAHIVRAEWAQREGQKELVEAATKDKGKRTVVEESGDEEVVVAPKKRKVKEAVGGSGSAVVEMEGVGKSEGREVKKGKSKEATMTVGGKTKKATGPALTKAMGPPLKKAVGPAPRKTRAGPPGKVHTVLNELMAIFDDFEHSTEVRLKSMEKLIREQESVIAGQAESITEMLGHFEQEIDELNRQKEVLSGRVEQLEKDLRHQKEEQ